MRSIHRGGARRPAKGNPQSVETLETRQLLTGAVGHVYGDLDGSGTQTAGEPMIANVRIYDDVNQSGAFDAGEPNALTNASGVYNLPLSIGTHRLREVVPAGYTQTAPAAGFTDISLADGQTAEVHFGDQPTSSVVAGNVYNDSDSSGTRNNAEAGLGGWTIFLDANGNEKFDDGEASTVSNANGTYYLLNVTPGTYSVREVLQTGWTKTQPTTGGYPVTLAAGQVVTDKNFGNHKTEVVAVASITGVVYNDLSNNGLKDGSEVGLGGWTVYLDANNNGALDAGEKSTTSSSTGAYSFTQLAPGTYHVREVLLANYAITQPSTGVYDVTLVAGQTAGDKHFGNHSTITVIAGSVYNDANSSGARDAAEAGLGGWTVYLDANNNEKLDAGEQSTTTNANGTYYLQNVIPGTYTLREVVQSGWTKTQPTTGGYPITIVSGQVITEKVFGNHKNEVVQTGAINGNVYNDADSSATRNNAEVGLSGWTIYLDTNNNGVLDAGEKSTTSSSTGAFGFTALPAGTYHVREVLQSGWTLTQPAIGQYEVVLAAGQTVGDRNFGNHKNEVTTGSVISGNVYNDVSADGRRQDGEAGLAGWTVYVDANKNEKLDDGEKSVVTDALGKYSLTGLAGGTYRIREILKTGWRRTQPTASYYDVTIPANTTIADRNFGNTEKNYLIGRVFLDNDANNLFSTGDTAQGGVKVYLDANNNGVWDDGETWTKTSDAGYFSFNVPAGTFHVREVPPAGQQTSAPASGAYDLTLTSGKTVTGLNFANRPIATPA